GSGTSCVRFVSGVREDSSIPGWSARQLRGDLPPDAKWLGDLAMIESSDLRLTQMPLRNGAGCMPALGFGTLIPDTAVTKTATRDALDAGFRHFDCAERYRNEREVGEALEAGLAANGIAREKHFRY